MEEEYGIEEDFVPPDDSAADAYAHEEAQRQGEPVEVSEAPSGPPPLTSERNDQRRSRQKDEGERDKKSRRIQDYRNGGFFIRNKIVEKESGEIFWIISPENPDEREQQFKVKAIGDPSADKTGLTRNMDAWMNDVVQVSLVRRQGAEHWEVWKVAPPPTHKDRIINRTHTAENGDKKMLPALEWNDALDTQVDLYHQYRNYAQTARSAKDLFSDPRKNFEVRDEFTARMTDEVSRVLAPKAEFSPDEVQAFISSQFEFTCPCSKEDVSSMLTGREEGPDGLRRVFYNTELGFEKQFDLAKIDLAVPSQRKIALSALANFCAQKAVTQKIVEATCMPVPDESTGTVISSHELSEKELVKEHTLFALNPLLDSRARDREERELSEMNAGQLVRSLMTASGANAISPEHDDVRRHSYETLPNGEKRFATFPGEIFQAATANMPSAEEQAHSPADAVRKSQHAILDAAAEKCDKTTSKVSNNIIWVQKDGGALKPPFTLEGPDTSRERTKKLNQVAEEAKTMTKKTATGVGSFIERVNEPVVEIF